MSEAGGPTHDVFGVLRDIEAAQPGKPRIGKSLRAVDDVVRFGQAAHLAFAPSSMEQEGSNPAYTFLRVYFMNLMGPMGPLPLQMAELANYERRYAKDRPYGAFLDVISNRMVQLFYRAWADAEPTAGQDRPGGDLFQHYVGALGGLADASGHDEPDRIRLALLGFAGQAAARRSPAAIADTIGGVLGVPTTVVEFTGGWQAFPEEDATVIGRDGRHNRLGQGAVLGLSTYAVQDACLIRLSFPSIAAYEHHLPDAQGYAVAAATVSALVPGHLDWRIEFELAPGEARPARLGRGAKLGWTSWVGDTAGATRRRDLRLNPDRGDRAF